MSEPVFCIVLYSCILFVLVLCLFLQDPISLTPTIVVLGLNPLSSADIMVKMDSSDMIDDDGSVDISLVLAISFALFHIYQVHYPNPLRKTMAFLEAFVFEMKINVPITVQELFNSLH